MKQILLMNNISEKGLALFDSRRYFLTKDCPSPDGILVRSADMKTMSFDENLLAVARAGAGVNNIPVDRLSEMGVVVFNTPGANANGVKELTLAALLLAARPLFEGITWASSLNGEGAVEAVEKVVEKGKGAFAGSELYGKTLGVIGLGAIGGMVASAASSPALGMEVIGYDPHLSVEGAWNLSRSVVRASSLEEVFEKSDFITLHLPATEKTKGMIDKKALAAMKRGVRLVNLSRAELVVTGDLLAAVKEGQVARYVTDFPTKELIGVKNILTIPHLGASTAEAEENCAQLAAEEMIGYFETGSIKNSVNLPTVIAPKSGELRLCVIHVNRPALLSGLSQLIAGDGINIAHMTNRSKGELAYTLADLDCRVLPDGLLEKLSSLDGVIRLRVIG